MTDFPTIITGCFKEAAEREKRKNRVSLVFLISILCTVILKGDYLYIVTFISLLLQISYVVISKEVKQLNIRAKKSHQLFFFYCLYQNDRYYEELSHIYKTLQNKTIEWLSRNESSDNNYTSPTEINKVKTVFWMLGENCFWNEALYRQEFLKKIKFLCVVLIIFLIVTVVIPLKLFVFIPIIDNQLFSLDSYFLPKLMFVFYSSFYIIERIDECLDYYNGSVSMKNLYNQIFAFSNKSNIDELLVITSAYYSILNTTPNISTKLYHRHEKKLNEAWAMRCQSIKRVDFKNEIVDCLKTFNALVGRDIHWYVIGSASLYLQGNAKVPRDIDIITDAQGMEQIKKVLASYFYEEPRYRIDEVAKIKSTYGRFMINNISFDIISSLESKVNEDWMTFDREEFVINNYEGFEFKLRSKSYEREIYTIIGDEKRLNNSN